MRGRVRGTAENQDRCIRLLVFGNCSFTNIDSDSVVYRTGHRRLGMRTIYRRITTFVRFRTDRVGYYISQHIIDER